MAHIVVASLTDAQFTQLSNSSIPYREIPQEFINRLQATAPSLALDEIMEKAIRKWLGESEAVAYRNQTMSNAETSVRNYITALNDELGLNG